MDGASILLVVAALGVTFGWQPDPDDPRAYEVTAQLEPELLDVLQSGRAVPIEAHIPAEIAPIRKIRVVVGNETLARKPLAASDRVVRGQAPDPQPHTARLPEDDPWVGDRYQQASAPPPANSRQFDQRGATIGVEDIRTAQAPSPYDRARDAVVETSNSITAGASDFGRALDQQYRSLTGASGTSAPTAWPAPPPPSTATAGAPSTPAWTSIQPDLAPPRLNLPALARSGPSETLRVASNPNGPSFPTANSGNSPPLHSVLADPAEKTSPPPDWSSGWGAVSSPGQASAPPATDPAEESRWDWPAPSSAASAPVAFASPPSGGAAATEAATTPVTDDRYSQAAPASSPPKPNDLWAGFPPPPTTTASPAATPNQPYTTPTATAAAQPSQPASTPPTIAVAQPPAGNPAPSITPAGDQLPWIPLLAVSVALAGSLGANLFLGWSYADARFRYRNLVRKTTNSFHRATGVAAA